MPSLLETDTGSGANIGSAAVTMGSYTTIVDGQIIQPMIRLTNLNGAAATFTVSLFRAGVLLGYYTFAKPTATATTIDLPIAALPFATGEVITTSVASDNASDSSVNWSVLWFDVTPSDATAAAQASNAAAITAVDTVVDAIQSKTDLITTTGFTTTTGATVNTDGELLLNKGEAYVDSSGAGGIDNRITIAGIETRLPATTLVAGKIGGTYPVLHLAQNGSYEKAIVGVFSVFDTSTKAYTCLIPMTRAESLGLCPSPTAGTWELRFLIAGIGDQVIKPYAGCPLIVNREITI